MVAELCRNSEQLGITEVSLNFAAFRAFFEQGPQIGAGPVMRAGYSVLMFGSRFFQMESLYKSNAKYLPDWQSRYLCFEDNRILPRVGLAAIVTEGSSPSRSSVGPGTTPKASRRSLPVSTHLR